MASWFDVFSLVMTTLVFVGVIVGVLYTARAIAASVESVKASLQIRGITISRDGVTLKTQGRFDREQYVDATQRGIVKALSVATVGPESHKQTFLPDGHHHHHCHHHQQDGRQDADEHVFGVAMRKSHSGGYE